MIYKEGTISFVYYCLNWPYDSAQSTSLYESMPIEEEPVFFVTDTVTHFSK
jgi:hypothetical protein